MGDGWDTASLGSVGMDSAPIMDLVERVRSGQLANIHSVLIVRRNRLVFEEYFTGADELSGRRVAQTTFTPLTKHDVRSVSKSVTSLLFGIALDRKSVSGLERPVLDYLPQYADLRDAQRDRVLVKHLLTMTAGFEWDETRSYHDPLNSESQMDDAADPSRFVITRAVVAEPGQTFQYSGGATQLLAGVLRQATGMPVDKYAERMLFGPLGITDYEWNKHGNGDPIAASGLRLRPRDLAKIGSLYLNGGRWRGRAIVSAAWTQESTRAQVPVDATYRYGYQWWIGVSKVSGRTINWAAAAGNGGQRVFVFPSLDLLVVCTAGDYNDAEKDDIFNSLADRYVLPAVRDLK